MISCRTTRRDHLQGEYSKHDRKRWMNSDACFTLCDVHLSRAATLGWFSAYGKSG
jgi:hypothetical protein